MKPQIDNNNIRHLFENIQHSPDCWWVSDEILTLKSPDSFSAGAYTESNKALRDKRVWATTDYFNWVFGQCTLTHLKCIELLAIVY